jgi:hypothetical protein
MDIRVYQAKASSPAHQVVSVFPKFEKSRAQVHSLLAKASETDQGGRYFNRSLDEIDSMSFVRDRGAGGPVDEEDEEIEEEAEDPADEGEAAQVAQGEDVVSGIMEAGPPKTAGQQALEAEWGLYRSPKLSQRSEEDEEEDTDDERKGASHRLVEEDFMVS